MPPWKKRCFAIGTGFRIKNKDVYIIYSYYPAEASQALL